jgi:hypothetical protein
LTKGVSKQDVVWNICTCETRSETKLDKTAEWGSYLLFTNIWVKKSKRMSWLGNASYLEEMRVPYISVGKPEGNRPPMRPRNILNNTTNINHKIQCMLQLN